MNNTHALAGLGGTVFGAALVALISAHFAFSADTASSWVTVAGGVAGTVGAYVQWFIRWKWPSAPPLPQMSPASQPGGPGT